MLSVSSVDRGDGGSARACSSTRGMLDVIDDGAPSAAAASDCALRRAPPSAPRRSPSAVTVRGYMWCCLVPWKHNMAGTHQAHGEAGAAPPAYTRTRHCQPAASAVPHSLPPAPGTRPAAAPAPAGGAPPILHAGLTHKPLERKAIAMSSALIIRSRCSDHRKRLRASKAHMPRPTHGCGNSGRAAACKGK